MHTHTFPHVCIDAHVARCPREALVFPVGYVASSLRVNVLLGKAKVNDVNDAMVPCT